MLSLVALGGVLALDATAFGQFMISRPLVGATLAGALLGDPALGIQIGMLLELFHLARVPSGGSRVPEVGPAAVVAVALAATASGPAALALGVAAGLLVSELGGFTVGAQRHLNMALITRVEAGRVNPLRLGGVHLLAMLLDFARGGMITAVGVLAGTRVIGIVVDGWTLSFESTMAIIVAAASIHLGALLRGLGGWRSRRVVFVIGLVAGIVGAYLR